MNDELRSTPTPAIATREVALATPFFQLIAKRLVGQGAGEPYYSLNLSDYVSVVATTVAGEIILVRQFRPAVEAVTLELPAGHVEPGQEPDEAARVELAEETGFTADRLTLVGCLKPDTGRLGNRMWVYAAAGAKRLDAWQPEAGVAVTLVPATDLPRRLADGTFDHALHVASLFLAVRAGFITL